MTDVVVVLVVLDAFPYDGMSAERTPALWSLAEEGGAAPDGGRAVLSASTYPNHATFATGVGPAAHRILTSQARVDGAFVPAQEAGPAVPTLFDDCRAAGRRAVAVFGDQNLVGVCGARSADVHWPPDGVLPEGAPRGALGYGADRAVLSALDEIDVGSADFLFMQLDETDTARHLHGPRTDEAFAQCRATDAAFGEILERLRPRWDETLVLAVSDHDQEAVNEGAVDLAAAARGQGLEVEVAHDGTAALVVGDVPRERLLELEGVAGAQALDADCTLVWGEAGQQFGIDWGLKAQHGSPRTAKQLAVVGGGHASARAVAREIAASPPAATRWAGVVREVLGLPL